MKTDPVRLGVTFGLFLALFHAGWALLVALGWAQLLIDLAFWAHFIKPPYQIEAFETGRALVLVVFVFAVGLAMGIGGGYLWNRLARSY
jgi:hypothetical protein